METPKQIGWVDGRGMPRSCRPYVSFQDEDGNWFHVVDRARTRYDHEPPFGIVPHDQCEVLS